MPKDIAAVLIVAAIAIVAVAVARRLPVIGPLVGA
jgi:hypothetical protein